VEPADTIDVTLLVPLEPLVESHWGRAEILCPVGRFVASDWARPLSPLVTMFFTTGGCSACESVELEGSDD
jgi:hypothetical protein